MHKVNGHEARAIMIDNRYFYGFGKGGRVQTAWSLAGAKLFVDRGEHSEYHEVVKKLKAKRKKINVVKIGQPRYEHSHYIIQIDVNAYFYCFGQRDTVHTMAHRNNAWVFYDKESVMDAADKMKSQGYKCTVLSVGVAHA